VSEAAVFPGTWNVFVDDSTEPLTVRVASLTLQELRVQDGSVPEYLRLDLRRRGLLAGLRPRPVLKRVLAQGATFDGLAVSSSIAPVGTVLTSVSVRSATERAFRWYRLTRSAGPLFSAVASILGGLLATLGAVFLSAGAGKGLLIAGAVLTVVAAVVLVTSTWRAPVT
jgi:hypothetical protein